MHFDGEFRVEPHRQGLESGPGQSRRVARVAGTAHQARQDQRKYVNAGEGLFHVRLLEQRTNVNIGAFAVRIYGASHVELGVNGTGLRFRTPSSKSSTDQPTEAARTRLWKGLVELDRDSMRTKYATKAVCDKLSPPCGEKRTVEF